MNQVMHVGFVEMSRKGPGAETSPTVENRHLTGYGVNAAVPVHFLYGSELVRHLLYVVAEIRVRLCQMQITAKADSVHRLAKERPADTYPVFFCVQNRIATLRKSRRSAKSNREQVGMQAQLVGLHLCPGAKTRLVSRKHAFNQPVKSKLGEKFAVRLHAYPAIVIKYIGFLAVTVYQFHQFFSKIHHETVGKGHIIPLLFACRHMGHMKLSLIDEILGAKCIAVRLFKFLQSKRTYSEVIGTPIRIKIPVFLPAAPNPDKVVKQGCKTHPRCVGMGLAPVFQPLVKIIPGFLFSGVNGH